MYTTMLLVGGASSTPALSMRLYRVQDVNELLNCKYTKLYSSVCEVVNQIGTVPIHIYEEYMCVFSPLFCLP
ncbi:hypothetical protein B0T13DRAFT_461620 [Neurospora crassa]|nr:hypothetical protein B0T13DRAFT_461620 [Neurospora crassa]